MELATQMISLTGSRSRIVYRALPENDPKQRQPDISRAQELLDWRPQIALKDGLIKTIAYFENLLSDSGLRAQLTKEMSAPA
jgi:UDP-glucuronate decarboxylase